MIILCFFYNETFRIEILAEVIWGQIRSFYENRRFWLFKNVGQILNSGLLVSFSKIWKFEKIRTIFS